MRAPAGGARLAAAWVVAAATVAGCSGRPVLARGDDCELSSACPPPLACRLGRCREECRLARDCPLEQACVLDADGLGACQLPDERECALDSECPAPLRCAFRQCTNACETTADCVGGASCLNDPERGNACVELAVAPCARTSECPAPLVCGVDGLCRAQCREDRDCGPMARCVATEGAAPVCAPSFDGGAPGDGAVRDGAAGDGAVRDGAAGDGAAGDGAVRDGAVRDGAAADAPAGGGP